MAPELEVGSSAEEAVGPTTIVATRRPAARQGARRTPVGKRVTTSPKPVRGMAVPLPADIATQRSTVHEKAAWMLRAIVTG